MAPDIDDSALDEGQYSAAAIRKYEAVYGRNFVSPGGRATTLAILTLTEIALATRVLDVGCGLGGPAFLMARTFGARVHGIDLSRNMLEVARERREELALALAVTFEHADILSYEAPGEYDLAHSRDAFLHIHDKNRLFASLARCLRPGGRLLFTDYLRAGGAPSQGFAAYIRARNYDLCSLGMYRDHMAAAGFTVELAEDRTAEFIAILERELGRILAGALPAPERDELAESWRAKLERARAGEQRWGVFMGQKPHR